LLWEPLLPDPEVEPLPLEPEVLLPLDVPLLVPLMFELLLL
jgi:hypothetical protein